ncbi:MAG: hypothetical protein ABH821_04885 [archaeon]
MKSRVICPKCEEEFELDKNEKEEGDFVECPECFIELLVKVKRGQLSVAESDEEKYEFFEDFDESNDYD